MRGTDEASGLLFSYVDLDEQVPAGHPLRKIRQIVNDALASLDAEFDALYTKEGRPSIGPERLIRASLLQMLFSIRSERQLMEQMDYNLLFRWLVGLGIAEINRALVAQARHAAGRDVQPTGGVIDSQSVKTSENTTLSGYDAGKRIKGRKRHIITDTCGNLIACRVQRAGIQDRDGAPGVFAQLRREAPKLRHMFADGGYAGPKLRTALVSLRRWTLQIVKRSDTAKGFEVLPRRWVVERTFA